MPCTAVRVLWGLSDFQTRKLATTLGRRSLLKYYASVESIRLHDVFRSYLTLQIEDPGALDIRLVDGWGDLHNLPDEYSWRDVAHHLAEAGRLERLRELLVDYDWLRAKLRATDPIALRDDAARFPEDREMRFVARALEQSARVLARQECAPRAALRPFAGNRVRHGSSASWPRSVRQRTKVRGCGRCCPV